MNFKHLTKTPLLKKVSPVVVTMQHYVAMLMMTLQKRYFDFTTK